MAKKRLNSLENCRKNAYIKTCKPRVSDEQGGGKEVKNCRSKTFGWLVGSWLVVGSSKVGAK